MGGTDPPGRIRGEAEAREAAEMAEEMGEAQIGSGDAGEDGELASRGGADSMEGLAPAPIGPDLLLLFSIPFPPPHGFPPIPSLRLSRVPHGPPLATDAFPPGLAPAPVGPELPPADDHCRARSGEPTLAHPLPSPPLLPSLTSLCAHPPSPSRVAGESPTDPPATDASPPGLVPPAPIGPEPPPADDPLVFSPLSCSLPRFPAESPTDPPATDASPPGLVAPAPIGPELPPADDPLSRTFRWQIDNFSKVTERKIYSKPNFAVGGYNWCVSLWVWVWVVGSGCVPPSSTFRWQIDNFSKVTERKIYSKPNFAVGGYYNWCVSGCAEQLSVYLDVADAAGSLPPFLFTLHALFRFPPLFLLPPSLPRPSLPHLPPSLPSLNSLPAFPPLVTLSFPQATVDLSTWQHPSRTAGEEGTLGRDRKRERAKGAHFVLCLINQYDRKMNVRKGFCTCYLFNHPHLPSLHFFPLPSNPSSPCSPHPLLPSPPLHPSPLFGSPCPPVCQTRVTSSVRGRATGASRPSCLCRTSTTPLKAKGFSWSLPFCSPLCPPLSDTSHQFSARESDWGFTSFMSLQDLYDPSKGFLVNDTVILEAEVNVRVDYWAYDSKKETGYVGLKNQGATCYMNSLLQTLYHIPFFRKAVYHMPTSENELPSSSIPLALQSLFYKLQYTDTSVATKDLTKSFGWDTYDSFLQHDVQELNRVLCEKLEDKMKGTVVEGTIEKLFEGHVMNYIECDNVDYKSTRKESFYDLQLDVKGCRDVYASFDKYVEVERLDGDNKYHAEQHGLQDAKKGVLFVDFPPVLQLQLKRFEYDFMRDTMVKERKYLTPGCNCTYSHTPYPLLTPPSPHQINDRYEFPLELDLDRQDRKYLTPECDRSVRNRYQLHRFKFDDERVTKEDVKRALDEQYGGEEEVSWWDRRRRGGGELVGKGAGELTRLKFVVFNPSVPNPCLPSLPSPPLSFSHHFELSQTNPGFNHPPFKFTKFSNAYMLVYIRESSHLLFPSFSTPPPLPFPPSIPCFLHLSRPATPLAFLQLSQTNPSVCGTRLYTLPIDPPSLYTLPIDPPSLYTLPIDPPSLYTLPIDPPSLYTLPIDLTVLAPVCICLLLLSPCFPSLLSACALEEKERKRKEKAEAHLFTIIKVSRDEDLFNQIGRDQFFDLVDHERVRSFRVAKQMRFLEFKALVEKEVGVPVAGQRFWLWARRQNHTYRPNRPLNAEEESMTVRQGEGEE
ncbi:unnamed protein product [Closterium sp. NIES-54]